MVLIKATKNYNLFKISVLAFVLFCCFYSLQSQTKPSQNYQASKIKTAFIYSFTKYVYWPHEDEMSEFKITVLGSQQITDELQSLCNRVQFRNKLPIKVSYCKTAADLKPCQILVVDGSDAQDLWSVYKKIRGKGTLMIAENLIDFKKAMISFIEVNGRMKYIMNKTKLDESNLTINELLYTMAITKEGEWNSIFDKFKSIIKSDEKVVKVEKAELEQIMNMYNSLEKEKNTKENVIKQLQDSVAIQVRMINEKANEYKKISGEIDFQKKVLEEQKNRLSEQKNELFIQNTEITKQRNVIMVIAAMSLVVFAMLIWALISNAQRRKANKELSLKKAEVEAQKHLVETKQEEILDSITYAKRIQTALMASDRLLNDNLPEYFVLFLPKDIVAGDFYWATALPDSFTYVTADSTGHGVPGAFMSVLNISKLNEVIKQKYITRPDLVLNNVRQGIVSALNPIGSNVEAKDGMDAVLCNIDLKRLKLTSAAANNSFCIVRDNEIITIKADKMPVGKSHDDNRPFTLHEMDLQKGDVIYTYTDGFSDQFGGPKGKKFKQLQLKELFVKLAPTPMSKQKAQLEQIFNEWRGNLEQVDDVLIIGVRV